jgi:hypothetical protein
MTRSKETFTMEIAGGLGNQLFMFYAGLFFRESLQREVVFDISDFSRIKTLHPGANIQTLGMLDNFLTINGSDFPAFPVGRVFSGFRRIVTSSSQKGVFVSEDIGYVNPKTIARNVSRIRGYFQSWFYFESLQDKPILNLSSLDNPSEWLIERLEYVKKNRVLALHVRRGDYSLSANRSNGILSKHYYEKAIENCMDHDVIWIFSDSPNDVEKEFENLNFSFEIIAPPNWTDPVESLLLMSNVQQLVISNSTFSWWSAMLAPEKTSIIAPLKWNELREDPSRLIPDSWRRLPSDWVIR